MAARPSHTFRMDSLLSEMRQIEGRQLQPRWKITLVDVNCNENEHFRPGPGVAVLARTGENHKMMTCCQSTSCASLTPIMLFSLDFHTGQ